MNRHDLLRLAALLAGLFLLAACGPASTRAPAATVSEPQARATPELSIPLEGTKWTLASLRGKLPIAGASQELGFYPDNYMEGTAGCNSYGANYSARGQEFDIAAIHRTDFECEEPPGIMPQDEAFFEALATIAAFRATEDDLEFDNTVGETILVYARKLPAAVDPAIKDTEWLLTSLLGEGLLQDSRITLNLGEEGFDGVAGCNNYGGAYDDADGGILLTSDIFHTEMDCSSPEGIMEQETAYIQALRGSATYRLADNRLEIAAASGETILVYARKAEYDIDPSTLLGTAWRLLSIDGRSLSEGSDFTLAFYSEYILGGHAGCRDYLATYQASGDDLNLLYEIMLDAGCRVEDADLELEAQVLGVLAPKADLRLGEGQLQIYGERGGQLVFESLSQEGTLDLEGPGWALLAFVGPNPYLEEPEPWPVPGGLPAGTTISITFENHAARGSAGCNSYGATYSRTGSAISFGTVASTEMACLSPQGIMEQEARYLELLDAVTSYHLLPDHLWLQTDDGRALVFRAP